MDISKVYLTRKQSRLVDRLAIETGITGLELMENAGRGCVQELMERGVDSAAILAGTGNNGGDGFVIARQLAGFGVFVNIFVCGPFDTISGDALTNFRIAQGLNLPMSEVDDSWPDSRIMDELTAAGASRHFWIVDAMLGTGATGNPRPPMDRVVRIANGMDAARMAVDVPTGLDADTGISGDPTFIADLTCTFVAGKTGYRADTAKPFLGEVCVIDIGVPESVLQQVILSSGSRGC